MTDPIDRPWLHSYAPDVPADIEPVTGSLVDLIDDAVAAHRTRPALEFFGRETSYRDLGDQIARAAEGLRRLGVRRGDRVALIVPNSPQHVVAFYAVLRLGAVVVEHNPLYTDRELRHLFEDHGATVAVAWDKLVDRLRALPSDLGLTTIVSVDVTKGMPLGTRLALKLPVPAARSSRAALTDGATGDSTFDDLLSNRPIKKKHPRPEVDDVALLQYTSGTTGSPKGAILTHRNLRSNAEQGRAWVPGLVEGAETVYGVLPFFHAYGLTLCLTFAMSLGARLVLFPKFDVDLVLKAAKKHPPTFLPAVPPIYQRLADGAREKRVDLSSARFAISGAMNLPTSVVTAWEGVTGGMLVEGFGLTETSPVALGNPIGPTRRVGTVGVPFPSTEAIVVDRDSPDPTRPVPPGAAGELLLRGPQVFRGYWNRPDETAEAFLEGGWFRTGDIVSMSADGYVTIVDRIKELIVTGGFNVAPSEVEEAVLGADGIAEAAVVGVPRAEGGEDVVAAVVLAAGATLDEAAVRDHCRGRLAAYKVPRRVVVVDELPKSLIGKVLRRQVRDSLIAAG
ncbi:long-chain-fatty-acid--CoA ligase [Frigoribacterium sp. CFBP9039]|uniref:long-chain-fatty-acid--CoA ligase n=1 Tax=unclassified Frigoribacterium TaxID=2627005 RepID=UPI001786FE7B|nr:MULTISPECIES: long-chain-fatty-acid--CoA ligase [unclassified Frigoribacterium]MBD8703134.1 AMP-binding protein [Frigoribacterium sp. CFBP 13712]MDY0890572.1 long-chain-fatty-acid--CoA ligase [Frigoribacterium sp. CFBP9030]MDY0944610.1 long-chain-fatty-acid--CoA ligase [Frigoribacterium sp. CFBP9039]